MLVKVLDIPAVITLSIQCLKAQHLIDRRLAMGYLVHTLIAQPIQTFLLIAVDIAPEAALTHAQKAGGFFLG